MMRTRMFVVLALLLLVAPALSISLPSTCPAASTASLNGLNCTQGTAYALPTSVPGLCSCSCGASSQNAITSDSNGDWLMFQATSASCTAAGCGSAYPTYCASAAYKSATWTSTTTFNTQNGVNGPPGCISATCNIGPGNNGPGTGICIGVIYTCNANAISAGMCGQGLSGASITSFWGATTAQCTSLLATPNASSFVTNYVACSTNMCNTLTALTATSSGSRAAAISASVGAALIALASLL